MVGGNVRPSLFIVTAAAALAPLTTALFITAGSPCAKYCGNSLQGTAADEVVCTSDQYDMTNTGVVYKECMQCQMTSEYSQGSETDVKSFLYNLRYNLAYCLWDQPHNPNLDDNPCKTSKACEPLQNSVLFQNMTTSTGAFSYCDKWDEQAVEPCNHCLVNLNKGGNYLVNYMTLLNASCAQRPEAGSTISFRGDPFANQFNNVTITDPEPKGLPLPDYGPVSLGARVGIAFGGLALILAILGFGVVCNGKRRRRRFLRELERRNAGQGWPHPKTRHAGHGGSGGEMFETPVSQRPLRGWDESPISAHTDGPAALPRYFSPYSSQYNSPVSATDGLPVSGVQWPGAHQRLGHIEERLSPAGSSVANGASPPPPPFSQWPSPITQQSMMAHLQSQHEQQQHEQRQREIAIGIALGGEDASLRSKPSNTNLGYESSGKGKGRDEMYEMHEVESPYNNNNGAVNAGVDGAGGYYQMPAQPQAPVLHHPGYGRAHGSRPGSNGSNGSGQRAETDLGVMQQQSFQQHLQQKQHENGWTEVGVTRGHES
ncbi:hypothetical protein SMACR_03985 [Sordaria macrospora]|uniref:WGS project CABT00000000 data, contig 2.17 n=2 Tax=Sordaria macrospora TaxID=5147 RepID=F7W0I2_SORMK|nr:uncharacterized protein SMAC_03985 [Sordaria macrospora k-hell]KAA8635033.1 hypothetical protein SMACR_03985 [Sordaria macrospora]KAH7633319.1 hypothetical protein B0T09DRAFT_89811 [Sordaria sp. MPI-SDFR-AT-0083]WPJ60275.1 hypothetical protein SMAC4_03985 [Sordaria macrospora]CCC11282.1 unnamed protein product [Sordaria macrospora k-hell]